MKKKKYIHDETNHNMISPNIVTPIVLSMLPPVNSVVDFGYDIGTMAKGV